MVCLPYSFGKSWDTIFAIPVLRSFGTAFPAGRKFFLMNFITIRTSPVRPFQGLGLFPTVKDDFGFLKVLVTQDPQFGKDFHKGNFTSQHGRALIFDHAGNGLLLQPFFSDLDVN